MTALSTVKRKKDIKGEILAATIYCGIKLLLGGSQRIPLMSLLLTLY
jgi:hypothetical protein